MTLMTETEKAENYRRVLEHDGWTCTASGWVMPKGFCKPLPLECAFKLRCIIAEIDDPARASVSGGQ